jgi:N-formylglutamate deformylase
MSLPLLISVPHAGVDVPPLAAPFCILSLDQIVADSDEGAAEIYTIEDEVEAFHTTSVARAIVDLNRAEDDRRKDGVVKTHTCWDVPVYDPFPPGVVVESLLETYYRPYHTRLREVASSNAVRLGVDCHTMLAVGPPVSPDPGVERPWVCLSNADGTCPQEWLESLRRSFEKPLGGNVRINEPFRGGYITRTHATEMPWLQLELSRAPFLSNRAKRDLVLEVFQEFCAALWA